MDLRTIGEGSSSREKSDFRVAFLCLGEITVKIGSRQRPDAFGPLCSGDRADPEHEPAYQHSPDFDPKTSRAAAANMKIHGKCRLKWRIPHVYRRGDDKGRAAPAGRRISRISSPARRSRMGFAGPSRKWTTCCSPI